MIDYSKKMQVFFTMMDILAWCLQHHGVPHQAQFRPQFFFPFQELHKLSSLVVCVCVCVCT